MNRILLVKLSTHIGRFPLGMAYLLGTIRERTEYEPFYYDEAVTITKNGNTLQQSLENFKEKLQDLQPKYVGFSLFQEEIERFLEFATIVRDVVPECKIIVGGNDPTAFGEYMIKNIPEIDIIVKSEGEMPLARILNGDDLSDISNLAYRDDNGDIVHTEFLTNYNYSLDDIPEPARDMIDVKLYSTSKTTYFRNGRTATVLFSRGCTNNCSFCVSRQIYGSQGVRSPQLMIDEIEKILDTYPFIDNLYFTDNYFPIDWDEGREFLKLYQEKKFHKRVTFGCQIRWSAVNPEIVKLLEDCNCNYVGIGLENFHKETLKDMGKNYRFREGEKLEERVAAISNSKLFVNYYFIINYPDIGWDGLKQNMDMIDKLELPYTSIGDLAPVPGTRVYNKLVARGEIKDLNDPELNWRTDFINKVYRERDWVGMTPEQLELFDAFLVRRAAARKTYYFRTLPFTKQLAVLSSKGAFNPFKVLVWFIRRKILKIPAGQPRRLRTQP